MQRWNLKIFRIRQGLTQSDMAARIGYERVTYGAVEAGTRNPSIEFFMNLQEAFEIPNEKMWELTLLDEN